MLSNDPTANLRQQRLHRRTQSTMDPYPTTEAPAIPNANTQRLSMHRRGISLDNRRPTSAQEQYSNSDFNPQQTMRGIQQQRLQQNQSPFFYNPTNEENYLISPGMTPQRQSFDGMQRQSFDGGNLMDMFGAPMQPQPPYNQFPTTLNLDTRPVTADGNMNANQFASQDSSFYAQESGAITPSAYIDFTQALESLNDDWGATVKPVSRPSSRPLSRNFARQFDVPGTGTSSTRHLTPPSADSSSYFPSPSQTPFDGTVKMEPTGTIPRRFQEDYDMSLEETIKPSRRSSPHKSNFQQMREQAELETTTDHARMPPSAFFAPPPATSSRPTSQLSNYGSETAYHSESDARSDRASPELFKKQLYNDPFTARQIQSSYPEVSGSEHSRDSSPDTNYNARQRTLSVVSLSSSHNPDENIQDTGISLQDIAQYISGPSPSDQKYLCLYPSCSKRFGRKENIKSHVQTHLGDRQFQCPHCSKCFVRQHDLKRHAKIHSGVKPYPCKCGNSFARHDALTRHRQRGMCVGAFEGVVKKVVKRGRPRKARPDEEERSGKAEESRSRAKVRKERSDTMTSDTSCSESDYSRSSYSMSPAPRDFSAQPSPFQAAPGFGANSASFPDFVTANPFRGQSPFRNESPFRQQVQAQAQQAELERISRNIFGDDAPPEFKLHPPTSSGGVQPSCVSPAAMLGGPPVGNFATGRGEEDGDTHMAGGTIKALKSSSSHSVVSNASPPGLTDSFRDSSSPAEIANFYDAAPDPESMFIDFGEDNSPVGSSMSLAQEASLLTLDSTKAFNNGGIGSGLDEIGDVKGGFNAEFDVDPADISLFNEGGNNSWLL